jgi:excisionase family DNA binding protein
MVLIEKRYYRPDELARELEEPVRNVYLWISKGYIAHVHVGKKVKITRTEVMRVLRDGVVPSEATVTN